MGWLQFFVITILVCSPYSIGYSAVLWNQSRQAKPNQFTYNVSYYDRELLDAPDLSTYELAGIVVPSGGWRVNKITVYFEMPSSPEKWLKISQGRLNIFESVADLPRTNDDPRKGKVVPVNVRIKSGFCLIEAKELKLDIAPGRYWIGLTPISDGGLQGHANHLRTQGRGARGVESVVRQPAGDGLDVQFDQNHGQSTDWLTLQKAFSAPFDETMAIKIEGKHLTGKSHH